MRSVLKWIGIIVLAIIAVGLVAGIAVSCSSNSKRNQLYEIETVELTIPTDAESIAEGRRLLSIRACDECHASDYGGQLLIDDPAFGTFYGTNITSGDGGAIAGFTTADWDRAIRHGVGDDGKPLIVMPSTDYYRISDEDLAMMIAYLQSLEAVDQTWPESQPGPMAQVLVAAGQLRFAAAEIDHSIPAPSSVTRDVSAAYGEYLADTCTGCHGKDFSGGTQPGAPPGFPPAANLTPAGNLAGWTQEDFIKTLRGGVTPEGKELDPEYMPWPITSLMTEDELAAIWLYFESLPLVETDG